VSPQVGHSRYFGNAGNICPRCRRKFSHQSSRIGQENFKMSSTKIFDVRYAHTIYQRTPRKRALHYTVQALRARGKRAVILPHAFGLPGIVAGSWFATSTASAVAASTATTARHQRRRQALRRHRCTSRALQIQRCTTRALFTRPA
jgi:hypothetical protein